jgi:rhamnogalacturonan endolyase
MAGTNFTIITDHKDKVELSFSKTWSVSSKGKGGVPLNVDRRYMCN